MPKACRVRLMLPDNSGANTVVFRCNLEKGHAERGSFPHAERGRVRATDGKVQTYTVSWDDSQMEVWRQ